MTTWVDVTASAATWADVVDTVLVTAPASQASAFQLEGFQMTGYRIDTSDPWTDVPADTAVWA